jgi:hypothetical protein
MISEFTMWQPWAKVRWVVPAPEKARRQLKKIQNFKRLAANDRPTAGCNGREA